MAKQNCGINHNLMDNALTQYTTYNNHKEQSYMQKQVTTLALTIGLSLAAAISARATLIAGDSFDYTAGAEWVKTGTGFNGGTGWGGTWSATSAALATNSYSGLGYGSLTTAGVGAVVGGGSTGTATSLQRILPGTLGSLGAAGSGTIWLSFLSQNLQESTGGLLGFREAKLGLFSGATTNVSGVSGVNGSERLAFGTPNTYAAGASDTLSIYNGSTFMSSGVATPRGSATAPVFVLIALSVDNTTAADSAYMWVNPSSSLFGDNGNTPVFGTAAATFTANDLSAVNAIRLQSGGLNASGTNGWWIADEIRVGYTFADVTPVPEPVTFALAGLGGLMLLALRRKS
jgi:hypothetical protein